MNYLWHLVTLVGIYSVLALSMNLIVGYLGLLALCHAAFFGIGAYISAVAMKAWSPDILAMTVLGFVAAFAVGIPVGGLSLRLKGDLFVLGTIGFQIILIGLAVNMEQWTGGPYGIAGIPTPTILGLELGSPFRFALFVAIFAALSLTVLQRLVQSPYGRLMRAIRDDAIAAVAIGKDVDSIKMKTFALSAAFAGAAGAVFAGYLRFIDPSLFGMPETFFILTLVLVGGAGHPVGPVIGATVLVLMPEFLRSLGLSDAIAANLKQVLLGLVLIALMKYRPQGILGQLDLRTGRAR